jgi:hypothetical protein
VLGLFHNMVELTHQMNETLVKMEQAPELSASEARMSTMKWKNISVKYVKKVKNTESTILSKQRELNKKKDVNNKSVGGASYGKNIDLDEMTELIEPEYTGDEDGLGGGLKQRNKGAVKGETFEIFMKRRSKRIGKSFC